MSLTQLKVENAVDSEKCCWYSELQLNSSYKKHKQVSPEENSANSRFKKLLSNLNNYSNMDEQNASIITMSC